MTSTNRQRLHPPPQLIALLGRCSYAPRANWLRNEFGSIELPEGLTKTLNFFLKIYRVPEVEVIEKVGCDGAILLRVFKLGIELFSTCSVVAIMLLAVNATAENNLDGLVGLSMANIEDGSDRMWAHVVGMWLNSLIVCVPPLSPSSFLPSVPRGTRTRQVALCWVNFGAG